MARKITVEAINAFMVGKNFNKDNTRVTVMPSGNKVCLYLHGNLIANKDFGIIEIRNAGWQTTTTKERLNGIPGVSICQRKGVWYLNGEEWDGSWTTV